MPKAGDYRGRCPRCEGFLSTPGRVDPTKYRLPDSDAAIQVCSGCDTKWIAVRRDDKILQKAVDKLPF